MPRPLPRPLPPVRGRACGEILLARAEEGDEVAGGGSAAKEVLAEEVLAVEVGAEEEVSLLVDEERPDE